MKIKPNDKPRLEKKIKEALGRDKEVLFAYLFGSLATGFCHPFSDLDIAVYLKAGQGDYYHRKDKELRDTLFAALKSNKVDLFFLNVAPLLMRFRIISEGELLLSRNEAARIDFETATLCRFFDFKPYLDEYNYLLREKILKGS
ncbi:MAG: nucleotidyltransferase domain-containing protein [bacterium]